MGLVVLLRRSLQVWPIATWKCDKGDGHKLSSSVANDNQETILVDCILGGSCCTSGENICIVD